MAKVLIIPNTLEAIDAVREAVAREVVRYGYDHDAVFAINLVLCEALTNAYEHGNKEDPTKHISVRYLVDRKRAVIEITDEGEGFEPESVPDPTDPERMGLAQGRGIMLMTAYADDVVFSHRGTRVRVIKYNRTGSGDVDNSQGGAKRRSFRAEDQGRSNAA